MCGWVETYRYVHMPPMSLGRVLLVLMWWHMDKDGGTLTTVYFFLWMAIVTHLLKVNVYFGFICLVPSYSKFSPPHTCGDGKGQLAWVNTAPVVCGQEDAVSEACRQCAQCVACEWDSRLPSQFVLWDFCIYLQRKHLEVEKKKIPSFSNIKSQRNHLFNRQPLIVEK